MAVLTGADVAASTNTTGSEGDWELEAQYGAIETQALNLGDAIAALGTATNLTEYLADAQTPTESIADLFGVGGLYAGATFPTSTAWRDLADEVSFSVKVGSAASEQITIKANAMVADNTFTLAATSSLSDASIQVIVAGRTLNFTAD